MLFGSHQLEHHRGTENNGEGTSEGEEDPGEASSGKAGTGEGSTGEKACGQEARGKEAGRQEGQSGGLEPSSRLSAGAGMWDVRRARRVGPGRIKTGGSDRASGFVLSNALHEKVKAVLEAIPSAAQSGPCLAA